jgi:hypothetical protein
MTARAKPGDMRMTALPCPRCLPLAGFGRIRAETIQPLPAGALAPLGVDNKPCCFDCQAADNLVKQKAFGVPEFVMARIAVGNDRQEQYRLPGVPMGLVQAGIVRPSKPGDFEKHLAWLDENNWFELRGDDDGDGDPR